jgi:23S rRNA (adenine2030-N6)-methyltransferase
MNYRHIYHAGNFADVAKHAVLIDLVQAMQRKEKGFCYIDTHAGIGSYDLDSTASQKTKEFVSGIQALLNARAIPPVFNEYLKVLDVHAGEKIHTYPGSPKIVKNLLRPQDRMVLNELHPTDYQTLKQNFRRESQVAIHNRDAYEFLSAVLPPKEKRALVLIDPAFEKTNELALLEEALAKALKKYPTGVYAVWLPIKDKTTLKHNRAFAKAVHPNALWLELILGEVPNTAEKLIGCAMVIVNPPFEIGEVLERKVRWLERLFNQ